MKKVSYPLGLTPIHKDLEEIIKTSNQLEMEIHQAAKKMGNQILALFPEGLPKTLLQINAIEEMVEALAPALFPTRTFLEVVLMKAIHDSQANCWFSCGFVRISYTEIQNAGLSVVSREETEKQLEGACKEIITTTNLLIIPNLMQWRNEQKLVEFYVNCEYREKQIPVVELGVEV